MGGRTMPRIPGARKRRMRARQVIATPGRRAAVRAWQEKKYLRHVRNVFEVAAFVIGSVGWILFLSYTFVVAAFG